MNVLSKGGYLPQILAAYASMRRIEIYLSMEEKSNAPPQTVVEAKGNGGDITLDTASFAWAPETSPSLGPLSVRLTQGELHMCVGPVAAVRSLPLSFPDVILNCPRESPCSCCRFLARPL
jgi:ABC-type multidrug transport system fused ATPase/permease subunit